MWRLYWHITDGYWKDDLCSPDDILHFWLHIPQVIKIFKNNKNDENGFDDGLKKDGKSVRKRR